MHDSVTVSMAASPEKVWDLVSDITRIGEFSPETFEAEWLGSATGPAVGAKFRGHVKRNEKGPIYWTVCKVIECERPRVFGFAVVFKGRAVNTWRYEITPTATGCDVTESFSLAQNALTKIYWTIIGPLRGRRNVNGMRQTLERMRAIVE